MQAGLARLAGLAELAGMVEESYYSDVGPASGLLSVSSVALCELQLSKFLIPQMKPLQCLLGYNEPPLSNTGA